MLDTKKAQRRALEILKKYPLIITIEQALEITELPKSVIKKKAEQGQIKVVTKAGKQYYLRSSFL